MVIGPSPLYLSLLQYAVYVVFEHYYKLSTCLKHADANAFDNINNKIFY